MNNKRLGTEFEKQVCAMLAEDGWWVHFIEPKQNGSQPFDIVAVRNGRAIAIDCKTCASDRFNINRLEDNQLYAFDKWLACGNEMPIIVVKHESGVYMIPYDYIKHYKSVKLGDIPWAKWGVLPV